MVSVSSSSVELNSANSSWRRTFASGMAWCAQKISDVAQRIFDGFCAIGTLIRDFCARLQTRSPEAPSSSASRSSEGDSMLKASSINLPAPAAGQPAETLFAAPDELEIQPLADISRLLEGTGIVLLEEHKQLIEEGHQVAILDAIRILREQNLLTQQNIEAIFSNSEHAKNISEALAILKTRKIDAKTWVWGSQQQILSMILSGNGEYAVDIATALCDLSQRDSMFDQTLATREHREAILRENGQHAKSISAALLRLDKEGILAGIWNEENRKAILTANGQYADRIAEALCFLYRKKDFFEGRLLNRDNRAAILAGNGQYAVNIAYAISDLEKVHILTKENRTAILANNGADAGSIAQSLVAAEKRRHGY